MKCKIFTTVFSDNWENILEKKVNDFLLSLSDNQIKYVLQSESTADPDHGGLTITIFYTDDGEPF